MRAWGRLLRLSLAPTAAADVVAGAVLGGAPLDRRVALLAAASLCVYHGGMALNDWADRAEDAKVRADRPIPSGKISSSSALLVAVVLLVGGPAIAGLASPRSAAVLAGVALSACAYDLGIRGPVLLALCRAGNLASGIVLGPLGLGAAIPGPVVYGAYVAAISSLARYEDADPETIARARPSRSLIVATVLLLLAPLAGFRTVAGLAAGLAIAGAGAVGLVAAARRRDPWTNLEMRKAVGLGLRRLLVFTAALAVATGTSEGGIVALAILCGYPISYALRGIFPPS